MPGSPLGPNRRLETASSVGEATGRRLGRGSPVSGRDGCDLDPAMNAAEAGRRLGVPDTEVRRLIRDGFLPYSVRGGRFFLELHDLDQLAAAFPDRYQVVPERVADFIDSVHHYECDDLAAMVEAFRPIFERVDVPSLMYRAKLRGLATAARNATEAVVGALEDDSRDNVSQELAVTGVLTLLLGEDAVRGA
jgi:hypothetical protein